MIPLKTTVDGIQIELEHTTRELIRVGKLWRRNAQGKLRREGKVASKTLIKSMKVKPMLDKRGDPLVRITPRATYWVYVDAGVKGRDSNYGGKTGQRQDGKGVFQYKDKAPPFEVIRTWIAEKGIKPRDESGKFKSMTHDSLAHAIRFAIRSRGLKRTGFITDTGDRIEKKYAQSIAEAYATDMAVALQKMIDDGNNN